MKSSSSSRPSVARRSLAALVSFVAALSAIGITSVPARAATTFVVRNTSDAPDLTLDGTCEATLGAGDCTLRAAIQEVNADIAGGPYTIGFSINTGVQVIAPATPLPSLNKTVAILGDTQPTYAGTPLIQIVGTDAPAQPGLRVFTADSEIAGLSITDFAAGAISVVASGALLRDNYIGINPDGVTGNGNGSNGIAVSEAADVEIRDSVIGGSAQAGIGLADSDTAWIHDNIIGLNASGDDNFTNGGEGVRVVTSNDVVVGPGNTISGNGDSGIRLWGTTGASVAGNTIGLSTDGSTPIGNSAFGIMVQAQATNGGDNTDTTIGGTSPADANVIGGNAYGGIIAVNLLWAGPAVVRDLTIQGNFIGTTPLGDEVGNGGGSGTGIQVGGDGGNTNILIGGTAPGEGNEIAYNAVQGIQIPPATPDNSAVTISSNSIHDNGGLGIDLNGDGVTANDPDDTDEGANHTQNVPSLTGRTTNQVDVSIASEPDQDYTIEVFGNTACDPSGSGEGETLVGETVISTDSYGDATGTVVFSGPVASDVALTATATNVEPEAPHTGDTSEFSLCDAGGPAGPADLSNGSAQLDHIWIGGAGDQGALSCQVEHGDVLFNEYQWAPTGSQQGFCGTYIHVGGQLYGPDGPDLTTPDVEHYDLIDQSEVTGTGTQGDPYSVVTTVAVGTIDLELTETDTYVAGDESYSTTIDVYNGNEGDQGYTLYRAADCGGPGSNALGRYDPSTGTVSCESVDEGYEGAMQSLTPTTDGSHFFEAYKGQVFGNCDSCSPSDPDFSMLAGSDFPDTVESQNTDNHAIGLSWYEPSIGYEQTVTYSNDQTFSPYALTLDADTLVTSPGETATYQVTIDPLSSFQDMDSLSVKLPAGFTYVDGSTDGFLSTDINDVVYHEGTNTVEFVGQFGDFEGSVSGGFDATTGEQGGRFFSEAWINVGHSRGAPTGPTAQVNVTGWEQVSPMPTARREVAYVTDDQGLMYAIGGVDVSSYPTDEVDVYDPDTDTWSTIASLPTPLAGASAAFADGRIFVMGGYDPGFSEVDTVYAYDPSAIEASWTAVTSMSFARVRGAVATGEDGNIYVFGGSNDGGLMDQAEMYDPSEDVWTDLDPLPSPTSQASAVAVTGQIWIVGGLTEQPCPGVECESDQPTDTVVSYYLDSGTYTDPLFSLPTPVAGAVAVTDDVGGVYLIGGDDGGGATEAVYTNGEGFYEIDPLLTGRTDFGAAFLGGSLYAFGGVDNEGYTLDSTERLFITYVVAEPPTNLSISVNQANSPGGFAAIDQTGLNLAGAALDGGVLAGSAGPQAAPLGKNPLGKNPLGKNPLGKNPLGKNPLGKNPLGKNPLGKNGLNDTQPPLRDAPVSTLINHAIANAPLLTSMPISTAGGWASVVGTAPLQTLTLNDAIASPGWANLTITDIDWSQTAFSDFSSAAWLLGEATPNSITGQNWATITSQMGAGCTASMTFTDLQLQRCDLTAVPWDQIPLSSMTTLANTPLGRFHLDGILLSYTPLGDILTGDAPAGMVTCTGCGPDLAHAQDVDGIDHTKMLKDFTPAQLATVNLDNLLPGMTDVTRYPFEAMTVAQLIAAADTTGQPTVDYTAEMDVTCPGADGTTMTVQLPNERFRYVEDSGEFSIGEGEGTVTTPAGPPVNDGNGGLTFELPPGVCDSAGLTHVALTISVVPGPNTGTFTAGLTASAPGFDDVTVDDQAPLNITQAQETGDGVGSASQIDPYTLYTGTIESSTDQDFFTIPLNNIDTPPGTRVAVYLSHLAQDDDLTLYGPAAASQTLRPAPLGKNPLGKNPLDDNGSCLPEDYSVQPQTLQDVPVVNDPNTIAVRGFSTNRSTQEEISCTIVNELDSGDVTVQVSGFNGASGDQPYVLRYLIVPPDDSPACQSFSTGSGGTTPAMPSIPSTTQTLILINAKRFGDVYGAANETSTLASLNSLASSSLVNGKVIPVESNGNVATVYSALDANPCSPGAANTVVRRINQFVDTLRTTNNLTDLRFIVLVGSDNIIPMGRVLDLTALGNQSEYKGDVRLNNGQDNPISRAFAEGFILSDDPYGSFSPTPWNGNQLYLPTVSTGRLVETPSEIQGQVTQFLTNNGRLLPTKSVVTGYDFTSDAASQIQTTLTGAPLSLTNTSLISDTWNTANLTTALNTAPQVISLNGHFDHYRLEAADGINIMNTTQYLSTSVPQGAVLFTLGCNAGVSMPDVWVTTPTGKTLDWAQAQSQKKGELIGNTGFGYGDDTTVAYSERLMALYAKNLNGTMSAGQALAVAKSQYYAGLAAVGSYDIKALEESTFYGLPMYRMGAAGVIAGGGTPPTPGAANAGHTSITAGAITTDSDTGLSVVNLQVPDFIRLADQRNGTTGSSKYFVGPNTQVSHYRPIEPISEPIDMTKVNRVLHDGLVTALSVSDLTGFNPEMVLPTIDEAANEPEPLVTDVAFPTDFIATSAVQGPLGRQDFLVIDGGRYVADPSTPGQGTQRIYTSENVRAFYTDSTVTDFSRPQYDSVQGFDNGNDSTSFVVDLVPDSAGDRTVAVYVMYRATGGGPAFTLTRLAEGAPDRWTGSVPGSVSEYFVQAVDENGNVGLSTFKGIAQPVTAAGSTGSAVVDVTGTQTNGWYSPSANVKITSATETFRASVDGGTADPVGAPGIDLTTDGTHVIEYTGSAGSTGIVVVPVDTAAPSFGECPAGPTYLGSSVTIGAFDGGSGIDASTSDLTKTFNAVGNTSVTFTAKDKLGHTATKLCTYPVIYKFTGFQQPLDNGITNIAKAGSTIPVKWTITNNAGVGVSDTSSFVDLTSVKITLGSCTSSPTDVIETYSTGSGLVYNGNGQWQLNWKTLKAYVGTCRTMTVELKDGTLHTAHFQFK